VPPGTGSFIVTGKVDGERMSLTLESVSLEGTYDEDAGLFTLTGLVDAQGADINMRVNLTMAFTNRPPRAVAGDDVVVECDSTAGTGSPFLSGAASFDLDGPDDLTRFAWYVDGAQVATGQDAFVTIPLGQHEVTLSVADVRGSFGFDTLGALVQDTTAPQISIDEPRPIDYVHSATLTLDYTVADGCTGVATTTPLLDGSSTVGGHGLPDGQAINLLTELALGSHTFSIATTDAEGNPSSASVTFNIIVTAESIQEAVRQFVASGAISHPSFGQLLLGKLAAAADARAAGNCATAKQQYEAFISTINAKIGKTITATAAAILIADARYLIAHCP
jgi:FIMAH domain-containing protein